MKRVIISSHNPVKLLAVMLGFQAMFPDEPCELTSIAVPSGVADQPASDAETLQGAYNRASAAYAAIPYADYWVGIEGGIEDNGRDMQAFAWVVVRSVSQVGKGKSATFFLPPQVATLIRAGVELGEADDRVFGTTNSKQDDGAVGLLTGGVIDRTRLYTDAVVLSFIPFKQRDLFTGKENHS